MSIRGIRALPQPPFLACLLVLQLLAVLALGTTHSPAAVQRLGHWQWPVAEPRVVLRGFVAPPTRYSAGHRGIDLEARAGTTVVAPADGIVAFSGRVVDRPVLSIRHDGDLVSSFEPLESALVAGDTVVRGEELGVVAAGGHCDGRCLHFGVRLGGEYVSPMLLLGGIPRAVLLPLG
ncbi:M23 family metallopeptidase [Microterricola viridarii]|uniref:M23ase beta-sheet core domain-containing protein n=1 Tax=Microterricola viridarii TaxID=412690 RepID=A0A0Y0MID5_9MICO|nr:M23 family metallopeptidase [Microterricola viridarii]AMB58195.1 hypothetical protein AWU67_04260 [Microterricola viridarii]